MREPKREEGIAELAPAAVVGLSSKRRASCEPRRDSPAVTAAAGGVGGR